MRRYVNLSSHESVLLYEVASIYIFPCAALQVSDFVIIDTLSEEEDRSS